MYESFFGFKEKPFNTTPDPRFLYLSNKHKEALAQLIYAIKERKGFVVLSGDVGTGKTTVIRALLEQLDPISQVAYIFSTNLTVMDLLRVVCQDFGLHVYGDSKIDYVTRLLDFLLRSYQEGKTSTLIIDEAQNLDVSLFEEIRMLTNLETSNQKLLQVFLVGQPELNDHLDRDELWQLKQRISTRYHLFPLDRPETEEYIRTRMAIAGATRLDCFTEGAIKKIYKYSGGVPRLINNICDNALLVGFALEAPLVDEKIVKECVTDLKLKPVSRWQKKRGKWLGKDYAKPTLAYAALIIILIGLLGQGIVFFHFRNQLRTLFQGNKQIGAKEASPVHVERKGEGKEEIETVISSPPYFRSDAVAETKPLRRSEGMPMSEYGAPAIPQGSDDSGNRFTIAIAREGDTLREILLREFGRVDKHLLEGVRDLNPQIEDLDRINVNQEIRLPLNSKAPYGSPESHIYPFEDIDSD
jgi:general secretion pathway protein A